MLDGIFEHGVFKSGTLEIYKFKALDYKDTGTFKTHGIRDYYHLHNGTREQEGKTMRFKDGELVPSSCCSSCTIC